MHSAFKWAAAALSLCAAVALVSARASARGDGPSFSCRGHLTLDERIICYDPELSRLDQRVADLYRGAGGANYSSSEVHAFIKDRLVQRADCESAASEDPVASRS